MKATVKRCFLCFCCLLFMFSSLVLPASAITTKRIQGDPWNYVKIYGENSDDVIPSTIIIYMHGDCNSGSHHLGDLEILAGTQHPYKYARQDKLPLPDDTLMICPQTHSDGEFLKKYDKLYEFIHYWAELYPDAKIILGGHSRGGMTTYFVANKGNDDVDGYFFFSTKKPEEADQLQPIENAFVCYGNGDNVYRRHYFSNLFPFDINEDRFARKIEVWDPDTNNVYFVGQGGHTEAPLLILEDIFWEWVASVPY